MTPAEAASPAQPTSKPAGEKPAGQSIVVHDFTRKDGTIIGGFLAWQGHAAFKDAVSTIDAPSGAGGAYFVHKIDLRGHEQDTLALTLRARPGNAITGITVNLTDVSKRNGTWAFDLGKLKAGRNDPHRGQGRRLAGHGRVGAAGPRRHRCRERDWELDCQPGGVGPAEAGNRTRDAGHGPGRAAAAEKAIQTVLAELPPFRLIGGIKPMARSEQSPHVTGTCLVAPDVLAITIEAGKVTLGKVLDYAAQDGDELSTKKDAKGIETVTLKRGGKVIGEVVGAGGKRQYITQASYSGDPLQTELADHADCYTITGTDDPAYAAGLRPTAVHRKSKPIDWFGFGGQIPARHVVFLHLPKPLGEGRTYRIDCGQLNIKTPVLTYCNETRATRSLAVHTTQIGYRADDPLKRGYLSIWLGTSAWTGTGGAFSYPAGLRFHLLDDTFGKEVFSGSVEMAKAATDKELMSRT